MTKMCQISSPGYGKIPMVQIRFHAHARMLCARNLGDTAIRIQFRLFVAAAARLPDKLSFLTCATMTAYHLHNLHFFSFASCSIIFCPKQGSAKPKSPTPVSAFLPRQAKVKSFNASTLLPSANSKRERSLHARQ